jgi:hypothetical protein
MRALLNTALAGAVLAASPALAAGPSWPPPGVSYYGDPSVPDFSGMWLGSVMGVPGHGAQTNSGQSADGRPPVFWAPWPLPYTPAYQKISDEREAATKKGVALGDTGSRCLPFGLPMMLATKNYPDEIVQTPGVTTIFMNSTFPIMIWTDGRPHPANWTPSYNGHSIGHWEGDTLYVDTVGIRGDTPMDGMRNPHSAKLHVTWSIRRVASDVLHMHLTLYDEDAYSEPVTMTTIWHRQTDPKWQILDDASCFENNTLISDKPPQEGFIKF